MAGSFSHVYHGWSRIENMGDASECVEELLWLVLHVIGAERAQALIDQHFYPMARGERPPDTAWLETQQRLTR